MTANCNIKKKDQSHITQIFYRESIKLKTPLSYIMYIMDHETISYKTLIQELSVQYNHLTLSYKNWQIHVPIFCLQTACLLYTIPAIRILTMNSNYLVFTCSWAYPLHVWLHECTSLKSQLIAKLSLSPVISTRSPLDLTCM